MGMAPKRFAKAGGTFTFSGNNLAEDLFVADERSAAIHL
jgi:hypothetical protein